MVASRLARRVRRYLHTNVLHIPGTKQSAFSARHGSAARLVTSSRDGNSSIVEVLEQVAAGKLAPRDAAALCQQLEYDTVGDYAKIDTKRLARTGFPEVIYGEGKTPQQVATILVAMVENGERNVMATRVIPPAAQEIHTLLPEEYQARFEYFETPRILAFKALQEQTPAQSNKGTACVLAAGTSDLPVAEEAAVTLQLAGYNVTRLYDVGVAGIHRLLKNQHVLHACDVAICVAGMDGALPGVVGGLTDVPVIAVPTSVGYGAAFGGLAPLLTMLNACSPGVGVVNIDNGFGAAVLAARILAHTSHRSAEQE